MPYPKGDYHQSLMWAWKPGESFAGRGALALEDSMALKSLMLVVALLVGITSLVMAQAEGSSGPLATSAGASDNPSAPVPVCRPELLVITGHGTTECT